ncbi:MAG: hypothetical protein XD81_1573 [Bacteroidetes bacterium 38_7]|nr:MAG: hypothetical protein XD81_1573 [Bacteroidetes bacterium 38_7]
MKNKVVLPFDLTKLNDEEKKIERLTCRATSGFRLQTKSASTKIQSKPFQAQGFLSVSQFSAYQLAYIR